MDRPLTLWAKLLLRLGLVLAAIGVVPALLVQYVFAFDALIPAMLLFTVAPLGGVITVIALILFLVALARRKPEEPS
jgi:hypothetical protein